MSDDIQLLQTSPIPLTSFQLINFSGGVGSGKTFQTMRLRDEYLKYASKNGKYTLDDFYNLQGEFTHTIYMTPNTPYSDQTLRDQKKQSNGKEIIYIQGSNELLEKLCDSLELMKLQIKEIVGQAQSKMRELLKMKSFREDLEKQQFGRSFYEPFIKIIEYYKAFPDYQALKVKETDKDVKAGMKMLYEQNRMTYDGMALRAPKVFLILDDCSNYACFRAPQSKLRNMLDRRRHFGLYTVIITTHTLNDNYIYIRKNIGEFCVFGGATESELAELYQEGGAIKSMNFTFQKFVETYHQITGWHKDLKDRDQNDRRAFMTIIKSPFPMVFKNFDQQLQ